MVIKTSMTITDRAKDEILAFLSTKETGSLIPGLIWKQESADAAKQWIVCAYDKDRARRKGFPGEIVVASGVEFVVVQRDTLELFEGKTLDYEDEQFVLVGDR